MREDQWQGPAAAEAKWLCCQMHVQLWPHMGLEHLRMRERKDLTGQVSNVPTTFTIAWWRG